MPQSRRPLPASLKDRPLPDEACASCPVLKRTDWCVLHELQLELLSHAKTCTTYLAGDEVFRQGDACEGIFCLKVGTVGLRKRDAQGHSVITRLAHAGETLGYRTYFSGGHFTATAEALKESKICFVDSDTVQRVLDQSPALAQRFLRHLAQTLRSVEESKLEIASLPVRTRVARLLLDLADRYAEASAETAALGAQPAIQPLGAGPGLAATDPDPGEGSSLTFELPLARQDMAALIGVRPESITRALRALEKDGVALFNGRHVSVPSMERLLKELELCESH